MSSTSPSFAFVLSYVRTGSTLLRLLLDGHPEILCPGEIGLGTLARHLLLVHDALPSDASQGAATARPEAGPGARLRSARAEPGWMRWPAPHSRSASIAQVREHLIRLVAPALSSAGARVFCDRTPENTGELDVLELVFPDARLVSLVRHPMDVVQSLLAGGYGVLPELAGQIARQPTNFVAALLPACLDTLAVQAELRDDPRVHTLRYEDLVAAPDQAMAGVFAHLGVAAHDACERALLGPAKPGYGDANALGFGVVNDGRVGRGWSIPAGLVTGALRERLAAICSRFDYPGIEGDWGRGPCPWAAAERRARPGGQHRLSERLRTRLREAEALAGHVTLDVDDDRVHLDLGARMLVAGEAELEGDACLRLSAREFEAIAAGELALPELVARIESGALAARGPASLLLATFRLINGA